MKAEFAPEHLRCPVCRRDRTLSLPMYPTLSERDQDRVVDAVATAWSELAARRR